MCYKTDGFLKWVWFVEVRFLLKRLKCSTEFSTTKQFKQMENKFSAIKPYDDWEKKWYLASSSSWPKLTIPWYAITSTIMSIIWFFSIHIDNLDIFIFLHKVTESHHLKSWWIASLLTTWLLPDDYQHDIKHRQDNGSQDLLLHSYLFPSTL